MHPLTQASVVRVIERAASAHACRRWTAEQFTSLNDRAAHPCGIFHGVPFSVFAKLDASADAVERLTSELQGLAFVRQRTAVRTPPPIAAGVVQVAGGAVLLLEALLEVPAAARSREQWRSLGSALALLHQARAERFGLADLDGFYGPLRQDNRPVTPNRWATFYAERRLVPHLRLAVTSGHLPLELAVGIERLIRRLPSLCGSEPQPILLHGDAQQNNFLTTATAVAVIDVAPYFGHPELDLALLDYFAPVPVDVFAAYREVRPIDPGFEERRELWRLFGYLAVVAVDGASAFGRPFIARIAQVIARYGVSGRH